MWKKVAASRNSQKQFVASAAKTNLPARVVPPAMPAISTNKFDIANVRMERPKEGTLVYVTGTVKNAADHQRFGVRVEWDLFDARGAKVGTAADYQPMLAPNGEWRFKALVLAPKAASAKLATIKED